MCMIKLHVLNKHMYLSGMWFGTASKTDTITIPQTMITITSSMVINVIEETYTTI